MSNRDNEYVWKSLQTIGKLTRRHELKYLTKLFTSYIALIPSVLYSILCRLLTTRNTYVYKKYKIIFFIFLRWYLCGAEKAIAEKSRTRKELSTDGRVPRTTDFLPKFGNLHSLQLSSDLQQFLFFVNYGYAHVSLLCFPLVMFVCFPLATCPSPVSVGVRIGHHHRIQPRPQVHIRPDAPVSTSIVFTAPVGMVTFRQSPYWYYILSGCQLSEHPLIHSTCGHDDIFSDHAGFYQSISQQHPPYFTPAGHV